MPGEGFFSQKTSTQEAPKKCCSAGFRDGDCSAIACTTLVYTGKEGKRKFTKRKNIDLKKEVKKNSNLSLISSLSTYYELFLQRKNIRMMDIRLVKTR